MSTFNNFIRASASYFGIPLDQLTHGSTLDATTGEIEVVLRVALTDKDVAGIAQRMERMALEAKVDAQVAERTAQVVQDDPERVRRALRKQYNDLTEGQRSVFGSFHHFVQHRAQGLPDPWAKAEPEEKVEIPEVVWLHPRAASEQQKAMAIGVNEHGYIGLAPDDLTPEQRAMPMYPRTTP